MMHIDAHAHAKVRSLSYSKDHQNWLTWVGTTMVSEDSNQVIVPASMELS